MTACYGFERRPSSHVETQSTEEENLCMHEQAASKIQLEQIKKKKKKVEGNKKDTNTFTDNEWPGRLFQ